MKIHNIYARGISYLILVVMLHMHLCSAFCATGIGGCCGAQDATVYKKSCCSLATKSDDKEKDCQDMHLSFFKTTGQFASETTSEIFNIISIPFNLITVLFIITPNEIDNHLQVFNIFHPPPSGVEIRISIQSFQI